MYLGGVQWFIYVTLFKSWWPGMAKFSAQTFREKISNGPGLRDLAKQVAFDNFVHYPMIYFPVFYVFKQSIQGDGVTFDVASILHNARLTYQTNAWEDNCKMWMLWIPGDIIVYSIPIWLRLPVNHFLSFIWICYLSFLRGDGKPEPEAEAEPPLRRSLSLLVRRPSTGDLITPDERASTVGKEQR